MLTGWVLLLTRWVLWLLLLTAVSEYHPASYLSVYQPYCGLMVLLSSRHALGPYIPFAVKSRVDLHARKMTIINSNTREITRPLVVFRACKQLLFFSQTWRLACSHNLIAASRIGSRYILLLHARPL